MPGIEKMAKKKREPEAEPKPSQPAWTNTIADMVFGRIGGKPQGYVRHTVTYMWDNKFRMSVLTKVKKNPLPCKPDSGDTVEHYLSWWLVFTPTGELISSQPTLPGSVTPEQTKCLVEGV